MNLAITADPQIPVPPLLYGGIERIIDMLITELVGKGHKVTLFAHQDSQVPCKLIPYPSTGNRPADAIRNALAINKTLLTKKFDIIHSFGRLAYLLPVMPLETPKLMSYQREPTISQVKKAIRLSKKESMVFTGCSNYITNQIKPYAPAFTVYNGVNFNKYTVTEKVTDDAPLIFLGRIESIKGAHIAIEIALKTNKKLIIAGNIPVEHQPYFDNEIKPFLNQQIEFIGPVDDAQKNALLQKALAFLMPVQWNEPFGIVMAEAMACGTPVIGFAKGAVPEVIDNGVTGYYSYDLNGLIEKVNIVHLLDRKQIRQVAEERFSAEVITNQYLAIYQQLLEHV